METGESSWYFRTNHILTCNGLDIPRLLLGPCYPYLFQSICNKKPDLLEIINSVKPDVIIGTETWLYKSIPSTDYFPNNMYNISNPYVWRIFFV
jgi:hypothetical protein